MRYRKGQKTPFKIFESEEEWQDEVERIVDMTVSKLNERLGLETENTENYGRQSFNKNPYAENKAGYEIKDLPTKESYLGVTPDLNTNVNDSSRARFYEIKKQADEYKKKNPNFNMAEEMKNRSFCYFVFKLGVSVEDAYFLVHKEEILRDKEERNRITENGAFKNQGIQTKLNPEKFTDEDVAKILDRIQDGENITF